LEQWLIASILPMIPSTVGLDLAELPTLYPFGIGFMPDRCFMPDRYRRQKAFAPLGELGQQRLHEARVAICGMGALGAMVAERLCRMGVGFLRLIDRDWVELDNLPRQTLYTTQDAIDLRPKAIAAQSHLTAINPDTAIETVVEDITFENGATWMQDVDCIVDGTDNFETRYLINEIAWKHHIPWVHAGIVGASGQAMCFVPGMTACFRCLLPEVPPIEQMQTCDSAGVLGAAVGVIASWQALDVVKILTNPSKAADGQLRLFDLWEGNVRKIRLPANPECEVCKHGRFEFLAGDVGSQARVLCGRGAVQIQPRGRERIDLVQLGARLRQEGEVIVNPFLVRFQLPNHSMSVFADGRAIIQGTENPDEARKIYSRWIGG
jgi:molybdopterin-synthase adenylyltransferase